ncbi:MAG: hypothetical protein IJP91_07500 [Synergistaceae bacterium]|nr:hypothetical protein [Synergistaceae bacterium]
MKTKRKAETLAESVISMAVFGVLMSGVCSFMSNQTQFIAWTRHRDELMYKAQKLVEYKLPEALLEHDEHIGHDIKADNATTWRTTAINDLEKNIGSFDWDIDKRILTVRITNDSMEFFFPKN